MGRLREIFKIANGKLPSQNSAYVKLRGIAYPIDVFLSGSLRFARKIGSPLPIWLPDNQTTLASDASLSSDQISLSRPLSWFTLGSKVVIGENFYTFVDDILDEGLTLSLTDKTTLSYAAGSTVDLYGHPLEINGTFPYLSDLPPLPDEFVHDLVPRSSVVALADTNQVLSGEPTIDDVLAVAGDRVLLLNQADPTENGIWEVSVFGWTRPSDFSPGTHASKAHVFVLGGTVYAVSSWVCTASSSLDTIDTDPLTWSRFSNVTTFVVHSEYFIYPGDEINYGFSDYRVAEALDVGTTTDGRTTYQITIDLGIPATLTDGASDQVYLRAYPAYASTPRPLPKIPMTNSTIGPFLYDRVSGSFFEDLYVEEVDVVNLHSSSGDITSRTLDAGKNSLVYSIPLSSDSFLFWDKTRGSLNYSRSLQTFVAFTDTKGKFHMYFECVPKMAHTAGFEGWRVKVKPDRDVHMVVELEPNPLPDAIPPATRRGTSLTGGLETYVNIDFPEGSDPISRIHVSFDSEIVSGDYHEGTRIDMGSWETRGVPSLSFISHATIAKVVGGHVWASGSAMAKPYWLRLAYLKVQSDLYARFNGGLLST